MIWESLGYSKKAIRLPRNTMDVLNRSSLVIRIPADLQAVLTDVQLQIRKRAGADLVRWTPGTELVLTLVNLGEIGIGQIAELNATLGPVVAGTRATSIQLEGLGGSPSNLQPRFLWIGLAGDTSPLEQLTVALERAAAPIVPHHEARGLLAHIPIGRLKQESESSRSALGRAVRMAQIGAVGVFQATSVELVRMATSSAGPTLVTVQAFPLSPP